MALKDRYVNLKIGNYRKPIMMRCENAHKIREILEEEKISYQISEVA